MIDFTLSRRWFKPTATLGVLEGEGLSCFTLEPPPPATIKAGTYRVVMTASGRAKDGTLWSPREDHKLPELLDVPGRTAIRVHAGNQATDTLGCILVAFARGEDYLENSRTALIKFMAIVDANKGMRLRIKDEPWTVA